MKRLCAFAFAAVLSMVGFTVACRAQALTTADVDRIVGRAVAEAAAQPAPGPGAIAVVDRVGNVLGVYVTDLSSAPTMVVSSGRGIPLGNGLESVSLPAV